MVRDGGNMDEWIETTMNTIITGKSNIQRQYIIVQILFD